MKTQFRNLLIFVLVLSMSAFFSACASSKGQKKAEGGPGAAAGEAGGAGGQSGSGGQMNEEKLQQEREAQASADKEKQSEESKMEAQSSESKMEAQSSAFVEKLDMIHFDFDKSEIKPEYRDVLSKNAEKLRAHPSVSAAVEGHCDEVGTQEYNIALGERRANATKKYLESLGVTPSNLSTISYGEEKPLDPGHTKEAHAKNRRAQFSVK